MGFSEKLAAYERERENERSRTEELNEDLLDALGEMDAIIKKINALTKQIGDHREYRIVPEYKP